MRLPSLDALNLAAGFEQTAPQRTPISSRPSTDASANMLQRTQRAANDDAPDSRYWTAYDHFMIEREARALRRQYVNGLIARTWRRLRERLAGSPLRESGPHR